MSSSASSLVICLPPRLAVKLIALAIAVNPSLSYTHVR
jgi:hypothetical protein